jgi:nucleotide-binding universal stress UspA family protein
MTAPKAFNVQQVLFASDFSPHSDHAFDAALALAQHFGARLHLLHVVHHPNDPEAARARLSAFARERAAGVEFVVTVATGIPAAQIVAHAEREKVSLIVMGSHGRTALSHVVRGSVTEAVIHHAPCLVLAIRMAVELPIEGGEPSAQGPQVPAVQAGNADRLEAGKAVPEVGPVFRARRAASWYRPLCLVCGLPSSESVCDACKSRIRAEAFHRWQEGYTAGR